MVLAMSILHWRFRKVNVHPVSWYATFPAFSSLCLVRTHWVAMLTHRIALLTHRVLCCIQWTHETPTLLRRRAYEHTDCTGSVLSDTTHTDGACSSTQWRRYYSGSPGSNYWSPVYLQPFNCSVLGWIRLDYYATSSSCGGTPMRSIYIPAGGCANGYLVRMTSATTATIEQYSTNSQFYCLNIISSLSTSVTHDECISPPPQNVPYKGDWGLTTSSTVTVGPGWSSNSTASVRVVFSSELSPQMLVNYQGICYGPGAPHGQDGPACSGSQTICNGACTDLNTDPNHCGQCGRRCNVPGITSCVAGVCTGGGGGGGGVTSSSTGSNNSTV